jgi:hypothetical protein
MAQQVVAVVVHCQQGVMVVLAVLRAMELLGAQGGQVVQVAWLFLLLLRYPLITLTPSQEARLVLVERAVRAVLLVHVRAAAAVVVAAALMPLRTLYIRQAVTVVVVSALLVEGRLVVVLVTARMQAQAALVVALEVLVPLVAVAI